MPRAIVAAILFTLRLPAQDASLTVDELVRKHTEALGGAARLKAVQNVTLTGHASLMGGQMEAAVTMRIKRPASMRMEMNMQGQTFVQAFDGATAWIVNPFAGAAEPRVMNAEDTRAARDDADFIEGSLVDYKAKGVSLEMLGQEALEVSTAYKLKVTRKSGSVEYEYVDARTFLTVKTSGKRKQDGQDIDFESATGDYRAVNGVMMPFHVRQVANGLAVMDLTIAKVEVNTAMDDALFRMPQK